MSDNMSGDISKCPFHNGTLKQAGGTETESGGQINLT